MIRVRDVTKRYGDVTAVDRVSFEVPPGTVAGFVGPNGAGKSSLLKIMATYSLPTSGGIEIAGHDVVARPLAVRRTLGYLPEHNALYDSMRVDRFLRFVAEARGMRGARLRERLARVAELTATGPVLGKRIHECSKGYRQRVGLAAALIHDPRVLILDEPTHGLDPLQVVAFRDFVRGLAAERTILFSSHIMSEVEAISDRILVIHQGRLLADDAVDALRARAAGRGLEGLFVDLVRGAAASEGAPRPARPAAPAEVSS